MNFHLYAAAPTEAEAKELSIDSRWWFPLVEYVLSTVSLPDGDPLGWRLNAGYPVCAESADLVARRLFEQLEDGQTERYAKARIERLDAMLEERCGDCRGTGRGRFFRCFTCDGKGVCRPIETWGLFTLDTVTEFAEFCRDSGGFEIW